MHPLIPQENQGEKKYSEKFLFTQIPWGKKWPAIVIKYLLIRTTLKIFARINFQNDNNIFLLNVQFYQEDIFAQTRAQILKCAKIKPKSMRSKEIRENKNVRKYSISGCAKLHFSKIRTDLIFLLK